MSDYLKKALSEQCLPPVLLISGNQAKKTALALSAQLLGCAAEKLERNGHPDFHPLIPLGKSALHSIESIRIAIEQSHEAPFVGQSSIFLIELAERMQPAAANALLKTLEEPTKGSTWILLSERPQEILPTILSRCTQVKTEETVADVPPSEEALLLRKLLEERLSYPKLALALDKIEKLIEGDEVQQKTAALLALVSDHFYQRSLANPESALHWEEPLHLTTCALERNVKFSTCLEYLLLNTL